MLITSSILQLNAHYIHIYVYFLPNLLYIYRCVIHHSHGEVRTLSQNFQLSAKLLQEMCYKAYNIPFL
jgi:uncharacterized membrane protein